jgi:hypothetical protein
MALQNSTTSGIYQAILFLFYDALHLFNHPPMGGCPGGRNCAPTVEQLSVPRWNNVSEPGEWVFVTSTVLGWVPVFKDPRVADTMAAAIIDDCRHEGVMVHEFVVMPEHIHAIISLPQSLNASEALNRLKGGLGKQDC